MSTASNHSIYAQWTANTYTVTFVYGNGSANTTTTVTYDSAYGTFPEPTRTGYTLVGWFDSSVAKYDTTKAYKDYPWLYYADSFPDLYTAYKYNETSLENHYNGAGINEGRRKSQYISSDIVSITSNITLYAGWSPVKYKIAYNANGGSGTMSSTNHVYNIAQNLTANTFTRTGYTFAGWATTSTGSVAYANSASVKNLSSTSGATVTLYAKWTVTDTSKPVITNLAAKGYINGNTITANISDNIGLSGYYLTTSSANTSY